MCRVLERASPSSLRDERPPHPPGAEGGELRELLRLETQAEGALRAAMGQSQVCRRQLQGEYQRARHRAQRLQTELFLRTGRRFSPPQSQRREGVASALRSLCRVYDALAERYEKAPEPLRPLGRECRRDRQSAARLLQTLLR